MPLRNLDTNRLLGNPIVAASTIGTAIEGPARWRERDLFSLIRRNSIRCCCCCVKNNVIGKGNNDIGTTVGIRHLESTLKGANVDHTLVLMRTRRARFVVPIQRIGWLVWGPAVFEIIIITGKSKRNRVRHIKRDVAIIHRGEDHGGKSPIAGVKILATRLFQWIDEVTTRPTATIIKGRFDIGFVFFVFVFFGNVCPTKVFVRLVLVVPRWQWRWSFFVRMRLRFWWRWARPTNRILSQRQQQGHEEKNKAATGENNN